MARATGLVREDSATIGFVTACYQLGAIDVAELNAWAEQVMVEHDGYPDYIVELREFDDASRLHLHRAIGFVPSPGLTDDMYAALEGIAWLRGCRRTDATPEPVAAAALARHPALRARFAATFPFVQLPADAA